MSYILVVDDEADIRDVCEMLLKRSFPLDVATASSGHHALQVMQEKGKPVLIVSDFRMPDGDGQFLHQSLVERHWNIPFVICSSDPKNVLEARIPGLQGYLEKPRIFRPLIDVVESILGHQDILPNFVPVRISLLMRWGSSSCNLYMKLSEGKYIKVINAGEAFMTDDAGRFYSKGLHHLYVTYEDAEGYLRNIEQNMTSLVKSKDTPLDLAVVTLESLESIERLAASLGWTPEVIGAAKRGVDLAIKAVSAEPSILKLLKNKLQNSTSSYSSHVGLMSLLTCGFCYQLGWTSESTQMKLGLASLMHDITIDEEIYKDPIIWNQAASDPLDKTPEVVKYRNHPGDAANLLLTIKNLPPDVDQIILQHHETKDGLGFPRGLTSSRISPMASVFIITEDLISYIEGFKDIDARVLQFLKEKESRYNSGNFKKVFEALKASVENARL
ncbi:response regulator [Peredibacter sp. HCB2-198]|uniref:response regulator n=1 Tax=Peredibacter sp. HCB2-198 TaxID=3383025 RepID=UPI0038B6770F